MRRCQRGEAGTVTPPFQPQGEKDNQGDQSLSTGTAGPSVPQGRAGQLPMASALVCPHAQAAWAVMNNKSFWSEHEGDRSHLKMERKRVGKER